MRVFFVFRKFGGLTKGIIWPRFPPGVGCRADTEGEGKHRQQHKPHAQRLRRQKCINRVYPYDRTESIIIMYHTGYAIYFDISQIGHITLLTHIWASCNI